MDFERYTDERVHMLKVRAMGQLLIIVFALVVLIKAPMFDIYCVRVSGYSMEASFHSGSEYLMKKSPGNCSGYVFLIPPEKSK